MAGIGGGGETIQAKRLRASVTPRACEGCKIRKIRCDRTRPCGNCQSSGLACQEASPSSRPEIRPRPDRETQLQEQIERLEERLCVVEQELTTRNINSDHPRSIPGPESVIAETERSGPQVVCTPALYEGSSSFTNQSTQARKVAQTIANSEVIGEQSGLNASLGHLNTLFQSPTTLSSLEDYHFSSTIARTTPLMDPLPLDLVIAILQEIKTNRPIFLCSYAINDQNLVERLCRDVYFPMAPISSGHLAAMYGILHVLLEEFTIMRNQLCQKYDIKLHATRCEQSFNSIIESYEVLAVPSFENIFALVMGFTKAQNEGKSLLCCTFISAAASHCQMLGYHHEKMYRNDRTRNSGNMRRLFWTTYVFEKHISLLFGRASTMQDFDIDAGFPALSTDPAVRPWDESFIMGIKLAQIQSQIYDRLYSTAALKAAGSERRQCVHQMATTMQDWEVELRQINSSQVNNRQVFDISRDSWDIMYYSTFTSLLRAPTTSGMEGTEISSQCFQVARLSLQSHLRCFSNYQTSGFLSDANYANWVLLFSSFTPFIVIFLHAIAASSLDDLQLLEDVVESLQKVQQVSRSSERLYQICSTFAQIARGLVEARKSCVGMYNQQDDSLQFFHNNNDNTGQMSIFESDFLQDFLGADSMTNHASYAEAHDILDCWVTGLPAGINLFGGSANEIRQQNIEFLRRGSRRQPALVYANIRDMAIWARDIF